MCLVPGMCTAAVVLIFVVVVEVVGKNGGSADIPFTVGPRENGVCYCPSGTCYGSRIRVPLLPVDVDTQAWAFEPLH